MKRQPRPDAAFEWFHHPEMQRRIRKAEADVANGRVTVTRTLAEAQALLDDFKGRRRRRNRQCAGDLRS